MPLKDVLSQITEAYAKGESFDLDMSGATAKDVVAVSAHIKDLTGKDVFKPLADAHRVKEPVSLEFPSKELALGAGKATAIGQAPTTAQKVVGTVGEALPAAGMIAGGLAVAPLVAAQAAAAPVTGGASIGTGIATGAFGAGIGAAAGESLRQVARRAVGLPELAPDQAAKEIAKAGGYGALGEGLMGAGAAALKGGIKPFAATIKAKAPEIAKVAERLGVKLTPADINTNPWLKRFEDMMSDTWIGADNMNEARKLQVQAIHDAKMGLSQKYGTKLTTEEVSNAVTEAVVNKSKAENAIVRELYKQRNKLVDMKAQVPLKKTLDASNAIQSAEQRAVISGDPDLLAITSNFSKAAHPGSFETPKRATFETVSDAITKINDKIANEQAIAAQSGLKGAAGQSTQKARLLLQIKAGLQKDLDSFMKTQPKEARALNTLAKKKFIDFAQVFKSDEIRALADKDPAALVKYLINTGRVKEFDMVKRAIGKDGIRPVQERFFQDIIEVALPEEGAINVAAIDKVMRNYKPEIIERVMDKKALNELKELSMLVKELATKGKVAESQKHLGVFQNIGAYGLSKIYATEGGRKLLTEGLKVKPGTEAAAKYSTRAAQFLTMYGITPNEKK